MVWRLVYSLDIYQTQLHDQTNACLPSLVGLMLMGSVGHKYNMQQSTAGMEHRSVHFVGNGRGRYPNKWMEQRPEEVRNKL